MNLTGLLKRVFREQRRIFLISDTHFDHKNIIRYCHRPFRSVDQMNAAMLRNWNGTVRKNDIVYHLGDLTINRRRIGYWLKQLNGTIILFRGNHDKAIHGAIIKKIITCGGIKFLLVHDPKDVPKDWDGWIIHGHKHNNNMENYPFINRKNRTINVSVELTRYSPVNIENIIKNIG